MLGYLRFIGHLQDPLQIAESFLISTVTRTQKLLEYKEGVER